MDAQGMAKTSWRRRPHKGLKKWDSAKTEGQLAERLNHVCLDTVLWLKHPIRDGVGGLKGHQAQIIGVLLGRLMEPRFRPSVTENLGITRFSQLVVGLCGGCVGRRSEADEPPVEILGRDAGGLDEAVPFRDEKGGTRIGSS